MTRSNELLRRCAWTMILATLTSTASAQILEVTGSGDVIFNNGYTGSLTGSTFTFEIIIDLNEPLGTAGGSNLSSWLQAVQSFTVDAETFSGLASGLTSFQRLGTFDLLIMTMKDLTATGAEFQGQLPLNYLGNGPYALTDITSIPVGDFNTPTTVRVEDTNASVFGVGQITSFSTRIIPEPTTATLSGVLLLFVLGRHRPR